MNERVQTYHSDKLGRVTIPDSEEEMTPAELGELGGMAELVRNALCEITLNGIVPIDETGFSIKMDAGFEFTLLALDLPAEEGRTI